MQTQNKLDRDYNALALFRYTIPSILSLLFMSLYQMVDAIFVSQFVSENALASINIVYPVISVVLAVTLMLSTGGSAIVARKLGEGKAQTAKEDFSVLILTTVILSALITIFTTLFMEPLLKFMGATPALWQGCYDYFIIFYYRRQTQSGICTYHTVRRY